MKKAYSYIAAMALCVVACSQEDMVSTYLSDSKAVHISAQIGTDEVSGGFQTRSNPIGDAEEQKVFNIGDQIAVTAANQPAVIYTLGENNTWTPEVSKYLTWESDNMLFSAYCPVGKNNASSTSFTVPSSYSSLEDLVAADYMTYVGSQSNVQGNGVTLPMERKMVRIVVNITSFGNQYESGYEVSAIKIHSNTMGYVDTSVQSGNKDVKAYRHTDNKFYALLAPTLESTSSKFITVTVKEFATNATTDLIVKGIPATKAGNSYEVNLTVGKDVARVTSVTINNWNSGAIVGGEVDDVPPATADANSNTITTYGEGQLTTALITTALATKNMLKIAGPMNEIDFQTLKGFLVNRKSNVDVDFSDANVATIPGELFSGWTSALGKIWLPVNVKEVCYFAFKDTHCTIMNFNELVKLKRIGTSAFYGCKFNDANIVLTSNISTIGQAIFKDSDIETIELPSEITEIPNSTFDGCRNLKKVVCKGDITNLGYQAFRYCDNLVELDISNSTKSILWYRPFDNISDISKLKVYVCSQSLIDEYVANTSLQNIGFTESNFSVKQH